MSENPFYRLAPFIQEYIYAHGWTDLHAVQVEACRVIFETDSHLLLATGTASGKTEAAFLPVLTLLHENPSATVGVLYVGPLKALINDQFVRLDDLLKEADIPVCPWHGDVSPSHKGKLLVNPKGVLQITPESLESMLINRSSELVNLFGDLRFVIIDEVHAFMGSDRGRQVVCQLNRLARFVRTQPRRIGLSATLGDYMLAEEWLRAGTDRAVITPHVKAGPHKIRLAVEHFQFPAQEGEHKNDGTPPKQATPDEYVRYIYDSSKVQKCLVFANSRGETEAIVADLRDIARRDGAPDIYHVHHGSISAELREAAEEAMREPLTRAVTAATVTLELGIDIGKLERIIQLSAPFSVSSFVQRLGRSGRRGNPAEMWFVCSEEEPISSAALPVRIPWQLLQCIAIIQLYLEEQWIEPIPPAHYPVSLLYHQTMSILAASGELSPPALAERVLTLPPFRNISQDDFRDLLLHLLSIDHVQKTEERGLIIGLAGERVVRHFRFYAVFPDNEEYTVLEESREIGSIISPPPPGERFALAGRTWEVLELDLKRKVVDAKRVEGKVSARWHGSGGGIHSRILERMRQVLFEDTQYGYLQPRAQERLQEARDLARQASLDKHHVVPLGGNTVCIFPWMGTVACRTLERCLRLLDYHFVGVRLTGGFSPYYINVNLEGSSSEDLLRQLVSVGTQELRGENLLAPDEAPILQKYDEYIPSKLLRKAFVTDCLDVGGLKDKLTKWGSFAPSG